VKLEPAQAELLEEICESPLISAGEVEEAVAAAADKGKRRGRAADPNQVSLLE